MELLNKIKEELFTHGASLTGFADLSLLNPGIKKNFTLGISIAIALDPNIIMGITEGPTIEYYNEYLKVNKKLNDLSSMIASFLNKKGYKTEYWGSTEDRIYGHFLTDLPHKTMATLSGLGWIGKCALLVNKQYGSAIRLTTVLTDIAGEVKDNSISKSYCGDCMICVTACPGHAPKGIDWNRDLFRDDFFNPDLCRNSARKLAKEKIGINNTICGICIAACPFTKNYLKRDL